MLQHSSQRERFADQALEAAALLRLDRTRTRVLVLVLVLILITSGGAG
jgi:hypothetical protein